MEKVIDRASYRRSVVKNVKTEEKTNPPKVTMIFLNEIIISMAILISILIIKLADLKTADEWIEIKMNSGVSYEILSENIVQKYKKAKDTLNSLVFQSNSDISGDEFSGEIIPIELNDVSQKTQKHNASTVIYETAADGISQVSEDAKNIKINYNIKTPVEGTITSPFGTRETNNPIVSSYHVGLDIAADTGTTIVAAHDGEVIQAGTLGTYGKCIMIKQNELVTVYAHCSKINVSKGNAVKQGEKIGEVGMTGNATGPHVHFEIRYEDRYVNPEEVI